MYVITIRMKFLWALVTFILTTVTLITEITRPKKTRTYGYSWNQSLILKDGFVNVMEEHHEALLYWYSAAETGAIKRQGNVLLHIDGHSDAAKPESWRKMPLLRMPRSPSEVKRMMEANDVFILAAAMTGLINRYIWVWPPFDTEGYGHPNNEDYVSVEVNIGVMYLEHQDDEEEPYVLHRCVCVTSDYLELNGRCFWYDHKMRRRQDRYHPISEQDCFDKAMGGTVEFVSTPKALELAATGSWITESDSVILDIDEDFYAVESAGVPMYDAGMMRADISDISFYAGNLFCVDNAVDETEADGLFFTIITDFMKVRDKCRDDPELKDCSFEEDIVKIVVSNVKEHLQNAEHVLCLPSESTHQSLYLLVNALSKCSPRQLRSLSVVGICMKQSPRSYSYSKNLGMVLCKGYHNPDSDSITFHSADEGEILETTINLKTILSQPFTPGVITLVRSVRDGYTPRKSFYSIEPKVLDVLKALYPSKVNSDSIHYDSELLGGKNGWYFRHNRKGH